jgi:hypothetical protein
MHVNGGPTNDFAACIKHPLTGVLTSSTLSEMYNDAYMHLVCQIWNTSSSKCNQPLMKPCLHTCVYRSFIHPPNSHLLETNTPTTTKTPHMQGRGFARLKLALPLNSTSPHWLSWGCWYPQITDYKMAPQRGRPGIRVPCFLADISHESLLLILITLVAAIGRSQAVTR